MGRTIGTQDAGLGTRGILDPGRMQRHVQLERRRPDEVRLPSGGPVEGPLAVLADLFWQVGWEVPEGEEFVQPVLTHPTANLSVGPRVTWSAGPVGPGDLQLEPTVVGVLKRVDQRRLVGTGFNCSVKLACGALGAFVDGPASQLTDRILPLADVTALDPRALVDGIRRAPDAAGRFSVLAEVFSGLLASRPRARVEAALECVAIASTAEHDRSITTAAALAGAAGVPLRSLQRLFKECAGVSPLWVVRRHRIIDAADAARHGGPVRWAELAAQLGYADQAHLTRDFTAAVGQSPAAYARSVTPLGATD